VEGPLTQDDPNFVGPPDPNYVPPSPHDPDSYPDFVGPLPLPRLFEGYDAQANADRAWPFHVVTRFLWPLDEGGLKLLFQAKWANDVNQGGSMDYKAMGGEYDDITNYNFGYTGAAFGHSESTLVGIGGYDQRDKTDWDPRFMSPYTQGDQYDDSYYIRVGWRDYHAGRGLKCE
jgi:hypothetical protein